MNKIRKIITNIILVISGLIIAGCLIWFGVWLFKGATGFFKVLAIFLIADTVFGLTLASTQPVDSTDTKLSKAKIDSMDGIEFEEYCTQQLIKSGKFITCQTTPPSGDFGADITATDLNGESWVFQCKRYKSKLDNTPIQEVVAAKAHYNAKHAAVITNSTFTDKARQLAEENEVFLIESGIFDDLIMQ